MDECKPLPPIAALVLRVSVAAASSERKGRRNSCSTVRVPAAAGAPCGGAGVRSLQCRVEDWGADWSLLLD